MIHIDYLLMYLTHFNITYIGDRKISIRIHSSNSLTGINLEPIVQHLIVYMAELHYVLASQCLVIKCAVLGPSHKDSSNFVLPN